MDKDFYQRVYEVACEVPEGRVTSYGAIAKFLGAPKSSRLVGYAMSKSHGQGIPAHRVVNRNGLLTGRHHFTPPEKMQLLLEEEGLQVNEHQINNFDQVFWDPNIDLQ